MTTTRLIPRMAAVAMGAVLCWTTGTLPLRAEPAAAVNAQAGQAASNKAIVTAALDRWAAGGSEFFNEMLTADTVWTVEGSGPSAGTFRGRDEFMARAVRPFVSRLREPIRPVSKQVWADGDHVIVQWAGESVARDGQPYRNRYVWIFRMAGGKTVEVNAFLDLAPYDDVLRRVPAPQGG